jgi:hypothetical protein
MRNLLMKLSKKLFFAPIFFGMCFYSTHGWSTGKNEENVKSKAIKPFAIIPLANVITTNTTLTANNTYLLNGKVVVKNNAVLTIEAGTRILGIFKANAAESSALIITRGSKIFANGTAAQPIIFTGRVDGTNPVLSPGDWGGIVILGNAPTNRVASTLIEGISVPALPAGVTNDEVSYGLGTDANDSSGTLSYVRVEYAGALVTTDNELNSFTFGGVGAGTTIDHCQAYRGADDSFEFFGGNVNAKYLISTTANDDAFDFDFGYTGKLQFLVSVINPSAPYSANANCIESDNDATGTAATPITRPIISNLTVVGTTDGNTIAVTSPASIVLYAANLRRNTNIVLRNSIFYGYRELIRSATPQTFIFENNVLGTIPSGIVSNVTLPASNSIVNATAIDLRLVNPFQYSNFFSATFKALRPTAAPSSTGAIFDADLSDPFFVNTAYKGAIPSSNVNADYWIGASWVNKFNVF